MPASPSIPARPTEAPPVPTSCDHTRYTVLRNTEVAPWDDHETLDARCACGELVTVTIYRTDRATEITPMNPGYSVRRGYVTEAA